jgi:hypothetical protein
MNACSESSARFARAGSSTGNSVAIGSPYGGAHRSPVAADRTPVSARRVLDSLANVAV